MIFSVALFCKNSFRAEVTLELEKPRANGTWLWNVLNIGGSYNLNKSLNKRNGPLGKTGRKEDQKGFCDIFGRTFEMFI